MRFLILHIALIFSITVSSQSKVQFFGQFSGLMGYGFDQEMSTLAGGRYIGGVEYNHLLDSFQALDFEASFNAGSSLFIRPFDSMTEQSSIDPYRIWARYHGKQWELRIGLQKIDFGKAKILRPLQWFNQMDPRDPLQLTNGVYGGLARYYFLNNANIWVWSLYGNEQPRGFDFIGSNAQKMEYGGRVQTPIKKGEVALSYHHRHASTSLIDFLPEFNQIPEDRFGFDLQLDLKIGVWIEASKVIKHHRMRDLLPRQNLLSTLGMDYTFGIGNGLSLISESMLLSSGNEWMEIQNTNWISTLMLTYPLTMFDNLSLIAYHVWTTDEPAVLLNFQHDFKKITAFIQTYYFPELGANLQQNELVNPFTGPGMRLQIVYNH
jgi:hypothetical protein